MNKIITHWLFPLVTVILLFVLHIQDPAITEIARLKQFDLLQQSDKPTVSKDIGVLVIDELSIEKYGQWPWKRDVLADIIWKLREDGAGVIVLPILFSEEDRLGGDDDLQQALQDNYVVIAQTGTNQINKNAVSRGVAKIGPQLPELSYWLYKWNGMLGPILNSDGVGVINTVPEIDGVVRRLPLLMASPHVDNDMNVAYEIYPSIPVEVMRVATGQTSYQAKANIGGIEAIRVPGLPIIKTDQNARIWLRWNKVFEQKTVAADDYKDFEGRTVIIGVTAEGLGGFVASPTGERYAHDAMATALQTVLDGEHIQRPYWAKTVEILSTLILGILIVLIARFTPYSVIGLSMIAFVSGLIYLTQYVWVNHLYLLDVTMPITVIVIVGLHAIFNRFILEFKLKQQIKKQFEHYLAPSMVAKLQKNPELLKLGGETKVMTFMFSDIRGFTPISEKYKGNPEGLTKLINRFLTRMTDVVIANGGTIDKFMGDCIMAFWNAPLDTPFHEQAACKTALEMLEELAKLNKELEQEGLPTINIGIGINTGDALVGNMGSEQRFDYSVIGDDVNLASRLESSSKELQTTLVIGEKTMKNVDCYKFESLGTIKVKGKTEKIKVYTIQQSAVVSS